MSCDQKKYEKKPVLCVKMHSDNCDINHGMRFCYWNKKINLTSFIILKSCVIITLQEEAKRKYLFRGIALHGFFPFKFKICFPLLLDHCFVVFSLAVLSRPTKPLTWAVFVMIHSLGLEWIHRRPKKRTNIDKWHVTDSREKKKPTRETIFSSTFLTVIRSVA